MNNNELLIKDGPHRLESTAADSGDVTFNVPGDVSMTLTGTLSTSFSAGDVNVPANITSRFDHPVKPPIDPEGSTLHSAWLGTCDINSLAGNIANQGWKAADHQIKIIESEFNELKAGIANRDIHELRDGIADVLFTVVGLAHRLSLPSIEDFMEAVRANLTKFDTSKEDAEKTQAKYEKIGVVTYYSVQHTASGEQRFVTFSAFDQEDIDGRKYIAHKWLKSYKWQDVNLQPLPETHTLLPQPDIK
jgi:NTP pyrophosphatase (non-canonical NTP hydrolase)